MATLARRAARIVMDLPETLLQRSNFYQAVRLLLARPGGQSWPLEKRVRFRAEMSHAFPGREISAVAEDGSGEAEPGSEVTRYRISTPNYCIAGGLGPLPPAFAEWVHEQARSGNAVSGEFLDLFNHRLNLARYRLKESCTPGLNNLSPEKSLLGQLLAALCGLNDPDHDSQRDESALPQRAILGIAGLLTDCRRNAAGLTRALSCFLNAPVRLTPFIGAWRPIEEADRMLLGERNHGLGQGAVLGSRVWDQQARVRLIVGPIDYRLLCRLLPPGDQEKPDELHLGFVELVRLLLNRRHDCEVRLEVIPQTVGKSVLTALSKAKPIDDGLNDRGLKLGETAWLGSPGGRDVPAAEFLIPAYGKAGAA